MRFNNDPSVKMFKTARTAMAYSVRHNLIDVTVEDWGAAVALKVDGKYVRTDGTIRELRKVLPFGSY